jgi:hypothetical protein
MISSTYQHPMKGKWNKEGNLYSFTKQSGVLGIPQKLNPFVCLLLPGTRVCYMHPPSFLVADKTYITYHIFNKSSCTSAVMNRTCKLSLVQYNL